MRFLVDAQLSPMLARRLREAGHEATHVTEQLAGVAHDIEVAHFAAATGAVLVTKDEDFTDLAARGILQTPLLWIRLGNMTTTRLWALLEPSLPAVVAAFEGGEQIVEVRKETFRTA